VENAVAAMALAWLNGMSEEEIRRGIASYKGVKRRFEKHLSEPKIFIDDYAHHPQELASSIKSVKMLYADKKVLGVFQPHLYSRTQDFYREFAAALSLLDEVILVEIYPARELPIEGVTSKLIFDEITNPHKTLTTKAELTKVLAQKDFDVLVTLGAGDIDTYIPEIKKELEKLRIKN
jgi:UDP-N-acetylmuramate--alanine ligase